MKKLHVSMKTRRAVNGWLFILPWFIGFALFYVRSLYQTIQFSVSELTVLPAGGYELDFVGLGNYITAFTGHGTFKQTLTTSLMNMVVDVPLIIFFSLFVAMLLNRKMKCRGLVRAIFFLPVLLNSDAIASTLNFAAQMMAGGLSSTSAEMAEATASGSAVIRASMIAEAANCLSLPQAALAEELESLSARVSRKKVFAASPSRSGDNPDMMPAESREPELEFREAAKAEPPSEFEFAFCSFLMENERDAVLHGMVGEFLPQAVFGHPFTWKFVETWKAEAGAEEDLFV